MTVNNYPNPFEKGAMSQNIGTPRRDGEGEGIYVVLILAILAILLVVLYSGGVFDLRRGLQADQDSGPPLESEVELPARSDRPASSPSAEIPPAIDALGEAEAETVR